MFVCIALSYAAQERIHLVEVQDQNAPVIAQYLQRNLQEAAWSGIVRCWSRFFRRKQLRS